MQKNLTLIIFLTYICPVPKYKWSNLTLNYKTQTRTHSHERKLNQF